MHSKLQWPVRLGVRTPGFHPGSRGSNPLRATFDSPDSSVFLGFFYALYPECPAMTVDNWGTFGTWKESVYL